jgi:hypothetical protein
MFLHCESSLMAHDVRIVARRHVGNQVMNGLATDTAEMTFVTRLVGLPTHTRCDPVDPNRKSIRVA